MSTLTFYRPVFGQVAHQVAQCEARAKAEVVLNPRVDVVQTDTHVELEFELPGVSKEAIEVSVEQSVLKVRAAKTQARDTENTDFRLRERAFGTYERSFRLADHLDTDHIEAKFDNGILALRIAKRESSLARRIEIQ